MLLDDVDLSYNINYPKIIDTTFSNTQYKTNFTDFNGTINYQSQVEEVNISTVSSAYSIIYNANKHAILSLINQTNTTIKGVDLLPEFCPDNTKTEDIFYIWYQKDTNHNNIHINYIDPTTYLGKSYETMASTTISSNGTTPSGYPYL